MAISCRYDDRRREVDQAAMGDRERPGDEVSFASAEAVDRLHDIEKRVASYVLGVSAPPCVQEGNDPARDTSKQPSPSGILTRFGPFQARLELRAIRNGRHLWVDSA